MWCRTAVTNGSVRQRGGSNGIAARRAKKSQTTTRKPCQTCNSPPAWMRRSCSFRPLSAHAGSVASQAPRSFVPRRPQPITEGDDAGSGQRPRGPLPALAGHRRRAAALAGALARGRLGRRRGAAPLDAARRAGRDPRQQGRRALRARRARPEEDDARRGTGAAADHGPVRPDRVPRPERLRARADDADARRRALDRQLRRRVRRARRRPPRRRAHRAPERCLVLGDADAIRIVRAKLETAGVNAKVVAERPARPVRAAHRRRPLPGAGARQRRPPRHPRPGHHGRSRHAGPRPRRQGGGRAREPAAAAVRGRRLGRRVRPRRRADDARRSAGSASPAARTRSSAPSTSWSPA